MSYNKLAIVPNFDLPEYTSEFYDSVINSDTAVESNLISELDYIHPFTPTQLYQEEITDFVNNGIPFLTTQTQTVEPLPEGSTPPISANGTPISTAMGQVAQAVGNAGGTIVGNLLNNLVSGLGNGVQESAGGAGASIVNSTIKVWFKKNWYWVAIGVLLFFGTIWVIVKKPFSKKRK